MAEETLKTSKFKYKRIKSICGKEFDENLDPKDAKSLLDLVVSLNNRLSKEEAINDFFRREYSKDIAKKINNLSAAVVYAIGNSGFILEDDGNFEITINGKNSKTGDVRIEREMDPEKTIIDKYFTDFTNLTNVFQNLDDFEIPKFRQDGITAIYVGDTDNDFYIKSHTYRFNETIDNWEDISFGTILVNCVKDGNENVTFDKSPSVVFSTLMTTRNLVVVKYFDDVFLPVSKIDKYKNGEVKITFSNSYLGQGKNKRLNSIVIEAICNSNNLSEWSLIRFYNDSEAIISPNDIDRAEGVAAAAMSLSQEAIDRTDLAIEAANNANEAAKVATNMIERIQIIDQSEVEEMLD